MRFDQTQRSPLREGLGAAGVVRGGHSAPLADAGAGVPRRVRAPFAGVQVVASLEEAAGAWAHLEAVAPISPYQRWDWLAAWAATEGAAGALTVAIVIAQDSAGRPVALLPLGIERRGPVRVATFLGGRESNTNMGLFDPALAWSPADAEALLRAAARHMPKRLDAVLLANQPLAWRGGENPLAGLPGGQPSPSFSHRAVLQRDGEAFLRQHQSAATRKKLRAKAAHLGIIGPVAHKVARTPAEIAAVVDAHLDQKAAKLAVMGLGPPDTARLRALLVRAAGAAALELHALMCGETIVATFGGLAHGGRFSGLLISHAGEPHYARCSPGELLLTAVLKAKCAEGFDSFDLGIGEARYKDTYCPIADALVDTFVPLTVLGSAWAMATAARLRLKAVIKRTPWAWRLVQRLRKARGRLRRHSGA